MDYVNNWIRPITISDTATTAELDLPDGTYRLTLSDAARSAFECIDAVVTDGEAVLTREREGTAARDWPAGSVIYCAVTAETLARIGEGGITSIVAGAGITIDDTDPANPVISAPGGGGGGGSQAVVPDDFLYNINPSLAGKLLILVNGANPLLPFGGSPGDWPDNAEVRLINASAANIYLSASSAGFTLTAPAGYQLKIAPGHGPVTLQRVGATDAWWAFGDLEPAAPAE